MKFIVGLSVGLVLGAVAAVAYSVQTGRDLRDEFDEFRSDFEKRDFEAMGNRLEARLTEIQSQLESRVTQVREKAEAAVEDAEAAAEQAVEGAEAAVDAAGEASVTIEETAKA